MPDRLLGRVTAAYRFIVLGTRASFIAGIGLTLAAFRFASQVTTSALRRAESIAIDAVIFSPRE